MKLQHFYSDWNGSRSKKPFHKKPTAAELKAAKPTEKSNGAKVFKRENNINIIVGETVIEVKTRIDHGYSGNLYRDMYRILK